jgi:hypothetical protein
MNHPSEPSDVERRRYETDVFATVWSGTEFVERALRLRIREVCLVGSWPTTEIRIRWQRDGMDGEITDTLYDANGNARGAASDVGVDTLDLIFGNE